MSRFWNRLTALVYLTALMLTSMPITVGILGWCPCGCLPEALVYPDRDGDSHSHDEDHHHHHSSHCRGVQGLPYCPVFDEFPQTILVEAGLIAVVINEELPPSHVSRLLRPPRV